MLDFEFPEIYIIRGGQSQYPNYLTTDDVIIMDDRPQIDLTQFLFVGNPPYTFELQTSTVESISAKSIISYMDLNTNGVLSFTLFSGNRPDVSTQTTFEFFIRITDSQSNIGDVTLTLHIPPILKWRDGMNPNLLDSILVDYSDEHKLNLAQYYENYYTNNLHYKSDSVTDYGGRIIEDARPLNDIRNFTEPEFADVRQDESTGNYGSRNTTLQFSMPDSFASMRSKVVITDNLGRSIEGWFQFYSRLEWTALPAFFSFFAYTISNIDLHSHLESGREDDEIIYTLTRDSNDIFDFIYEDNNAHNGILRFKGIEEDLEDMLTINLKAQDRAYDNRYTELELTIAVDTPSNEQEVVRADVVVLGSFGAVERALPPPSVFDTLSEVFDPPPVRTILPDVAELAQKPLSEGPSFPIRFNIHDYIQGGTPPYRFFVIEYNEVTDSIRATISTDERISINVDTGIVEYTPIGNYLDNEISITLEVTDQNTNPSERANDQVLAYANEPVRVDERPLIIEDAIVGGEQVEINIRVEDNLIVIGTPVEDTDYWLQQYLANTCGMVVSKTIIDSLGITAADFDIDAAIEAIGETIAGRPVPANPERVAALREFGRTLESGGLDRELSVSEVIHLGTIMNVFAGVENPARGTSIGSLPELFAAFGIMSQTIKITHPGLVVRNLESGNRLVANVDSYELQDGGVGEVIDTIDAFESEHGYGLDPLVAEKFQQVYNEDAMIQDIPPEKLANLEAEGVIIGSQADRLQVLGVTPESLSNFTEDNYNALFDANGVRTNTYNAIQDILGIEPIELLPSAAQARIRESQGNRTSGPSGNHAVSLTGFIITDPNNPSLRDSQVVINDSLIAGGGTTLSGEEFFEAWADSNFQATTVGNGDISEIEAVYVEQDFLLSEIAKELRTNSESIPPNATPGEILEIREERLPNRSGLSDRWDEQEPKWEEEKEYMMDTYNIDLDEFGADFEQILEENVE